MSVSDWTTVPLAAYLDLITYGFTNPMPSTDDGPYMVTAKDVRGGRIQYESARRTSPQAFADLLTAKSRPRVGDVLLTKDGSIGRVAVCDRDDVCINQSVALLRPNAKIRPRFLSYLLQAPIYQERMESDSDGSTIKHIYITRVDKMPISVPELVAQDAIVEVLGALDDKIAANAKLFGSIEGMLELEASARWLGRGDLNKVEITDLFEVNPTNPRPVGDEPIYIDMKKLPEIGSGIAAAERREAKGGTRFMQGDTLLARITPCLENRKTGFVDSLGVGEVGIGSTEFIALRSRPPFAKVLSYFVAVNEDFRNYAIRHMAGTSGRQRVSAADIASYRVPRPDESWIEGFGIRATSHFAHTKSLRDENRTLVSLRDTLLPHLMSGKLRVRDAEHTLSEVL